MRGATRPLELVFTRALTHLQQQHKRRQLVDDTADIKTAGQNACPLPGPHSHSPSCHLSPLPLNAKSASAWSPTQLRQECLRYTPRAQERTEPVRALVFFVRHIIINSGNPATVRLCSVNKIPVPGSGGDAGPCPGTDILSGRWCATRRTRCHRLPGKPHSQLFYTVNR